MCVVSSGYGVEHAQCVPPSEYSEPGFITESYQTLHPISSEELLTLKYESEYPPVILRDTPLNPLQGDYFSVKQEVVSPDNMCVGRLSRGKEPHIRQRIISERVIKRLDKSSSISLHAKVCVGAGVRAVVPKPPKTLSCHIGVHVLEMKKSRPAGWFVVRAETSHSL